MAQITFKGIAVKTSGELPKVGSVLPAFHLLKTDLSELTGDGLRGKKVILNIAPSVDTGVCSKSMIEFNKQISSMDNVVVVGVTMDLPFAIARHNQSHGLENIIGCSGFRSSFGADYGVKMIDGPLAGLYARAIVVADAHGNVIHTQLVPEITTEPDYAKALSA